MNWKQIFIGVLVYALALTAGYGLPLAAGLVRRNCRTLIAVGRMESSIWRQVSNSFNI